MNTFTSFLKFKCPIFLKQINYSLIFLKKIKRNIYLFGRQLVIGDLGNVKDLSGNAKSSRSNQTFGTANYLAPEAYDLNRSYEIDIWSFGCIVYELFNLEKLFNIRHHDRLRDSIRRFQVETHLNPEKIKPLYVKVVKKYLLFFSFIFIFHYHYFGKWYVFFYHFYDKTTQK